MTFFLLSTGRNSLLARAAIAGANFRCRFFLINFFGARFGFFFCHLFTVNKGSLAFFKLHVKRLQFGRFPYLSFSKDIEEI